MSKRRMFHFKVKVASPRLASSFLTGPCCSDEQLGIHFRSDPRCHSIFDLDAHAHTPSPPHLGPSLILYSYS
jgi:hypothetical protein